MSVVVQREEDRPLYCKIVCMNYRGLKNNSLSQFKQFSNYHIAISMKKFIWNKEISIFKSSKYVTEC